MSVKAILMILVFLGMIIHILISRKRQDADLSRSSQPTKELWQVLILFTILFLGEAVVNWLVYVVEAQNNSIADHIYWAKYILILSLLVSFLIIDRRKLSDIGFRKPVNHTIYTTGIALFLI